MAYTTSWIDEPWLFKFTLSTTADYLPSMHELASLLDNVNGHLYVVSDLSLLSNIGSLQTFTSGELFQLVTRVLQHPNLGHWATAHPGKFMRFVAAMLSQKRAPQTGDSETMVFQGGGAKTSIVSVVADAENICRRVAEVDALRATAFSAVTISQ